MKNKLLLALGISLFAGASHATIFNFDLADSLEGGVATPYYGLRLDGLYSGSSSDIYTFSFQDVSMTVDSDADTAVLGGSLLGGTEGNGRDRDTSWAFSFTYTGLDVDNNDGSWEFNAGSDGAGSITNFNNILDDTDNDIFHLVEFMGSDGFGPKGDGGPCRTNDGPWCGNGWLNHSINPDSPVDNWQNIHLSASDFLYTGTPVPEPTSLALIALGLFGVGYSAKKRRKT